MGLLKKIFGNDRAQAGQGPPTSQFQESDTSTEVGSSRNAPRRELVQVVLRDTMRKHGIPSDWIDCRILSVVSRSSVSGMHVHFVVKQGEDRLLHYVHAFQSSFMLEIEKFEPRAKDWLLSLSWQFEGNDYSSPSDGAWLVGVNGRAAPAPGATPAPALLSEVLLDEEDDVEQDLKALFAIRDQAIKDTAPAPVEELRDFQPTQPGFENSGAKRTGR